MGLAFLTLAFVSLLYVLNVYFANQFKFEKTYRLRLYPVATTPLPPNSRLTWEDMKFTLGWLSDEASGSYTTQRSYVGLYTTRVLTNEEQIKVNDLSLSPTLSPSSHAMILPILVKAESSEGLKPGMIVAFAKEKLVIPSDKQLSKNSAVLGVKLVAIVQSAEKSTNKVLWVELRESQVELASTLANGEWVPIVLDP
jgi:hypothetical protein